MLFPTSVLVLTEDERETTARIAQVQLEFPSHLSEEAKDLLAKLLVYDPKQRISLDEVKASAFMQKNGAQPTTAPVPSASLSATTDDLKAPHGALSGENKENETVEPNKIPI